MVPSLSGAMENPGLITIAASIATGAVHADERALVALVLAHEVAHAWFGTVVTLRTWRELWSTRARDLDVRGRSKLRELPTPTRAATDHARPARGDRRGPKPISAWRAAAGDDRAPARAARRPHLNRRARR
ncbi:MAG: hypothetical protein IPL61_06520 [Myxococcales bacterium]|nr:hypothetical protein [Myxococcales bacterium]